MGQFSFTCAISGESISNLYGEDILFITPEKNYLEKNYEGYGEFGGIDVYDWLGKQYIKENNLQKPENEKYSYRKIGIDLFFSDNYEKFSTPIKIVKEKYYSGENYIDLQPSKSCPNQGWVDEFGNLDKECEDMEIFWENELKIKG
jgi:hypothetical protein